MVHAKPMNTTAVVLKKPCKLELTKLRLTERSPSDVIVDVLWSGISTGTERLLYEGSMPPFPGMKYPLVPGYEAVGVVSEAPAGSHRKVGNMVFVPGAHCFEGVSGLFGASASRIHVCAARTYRVPEEFGDKAVLLALAATAHHALVVGGTIAPKLIIGHGVLGRLIARIAIAIGHPPPLVWETNSKRREGHHGYRVIDPSEDNSAAYRSIVDASGDTSVLDKAIPHLERNGIVTLAGFYHEPLSFAFPPAFMREAQIRIAAEFTPDDVNKVIELTRNGDLSLDGLITHSMEAAKAPEAYEAAFSDPECLKMVLDWRSLS